MFHGKRATREEAYSRVWYKHGGAGRHRSRYCLSFLISYKPPLVSIAPGRTFKRERLCSCCVAIANAARASHFSSKALGWVSKRHPQRPRWITKSDPSHMHPQRLGLRKAHRQTIFFILQLYQARPFLGVDLATPGHRSRWSVVAGVYRVLRRVERGLRAKPGHPCSCRGGAHARVYNSVSVWEQQVRTRVDGKAPL